MSEPVRPLTRRAAMQQIGVGVATLPLAHVLGCAAETIAAPDAAIDDAAIDGAAIDGAAIDGAAIDAPAPDAAVTFDAGPNLWATGGTASMAADYPDPFGALPATCAPLCPTTLGPCYAETIERRDISEGYPGLPVRLALRIVDDACTPVEGAVVDVWHTRNSGVYSGPDAPASCTLDDADAATHRFFRGTQTTDATGRVAFHTCFPGWYRGRAIHIHLQIRLGGGAYVTSQLFFDEAITRDVFLTHPEYASFGLPDRTNATDGFFPTERSESHVLEWVRQPDRVMLAWKTLVIRSSLAEPLCP